MAAPLGCPACAWAVCCETARDSASAPALSTSAQAVPSGYFNTPCCCTMSARRKGIIIRIPSNAPSTPTIMTRPACRSNPKIRMAGMVTPTPKAMDSPAEPAVCTILFSRMVASRPPSLAQRRKRLRLNDRHRNGGADGHADLEDQIKGGGAKNHPQEHAQDDRARRKLAQFCFRPNEGLRVGFCGHRGRGLRRHARILPGAGGDASRGWGRKKRKRER